jgi:hypothetical protein
VKKLILPLLCLSLAAVLEAAKIKVQAEPDASFDFATVKTFAWDADAGDVKMALTPKDDPAALKAFVDPKIQQYVSDAMVKQGKMVAVSIKPDVNFHYYVLVTINTNEQYMGQFLPAVPYWGLPGFNAGTSSLEVVTKGALVLDALLPGEVGNRKVVWRGIAQSTVEGDDKPAVRDARLREACSELVKKFPLKKKNT